MIRCAGEPISWLRLERYALGELPAGERAAVSGHLEACEACADCLDRVRADASRALPPLPAAARVVAGRERRVRRLWAWGGVAAAAAAILLAVIVLRSRPRSEGEAGGIPGARVAIKGGELALEVVRARGRTVSYEPRTWAPKDRFKVLLTCPPNGPLYADAVIFQDGEASFPLSASEIECGNRIALSGAFRITGRGSALVCVLVDDAGPPDRVQVAAVGAEGLRDAVCAELAYVPR